MRGTLGCKWNTTQQECGKRENRLSMKTNPAVVNEIV